MNGKWIKQDENVWSYKVRVDGRLVLVSAVTMKDINLYNIYNYFDWDEGEYHGSLSDAKHAALEMAFASMLKIATYIYNEKIKTGGQK